ncbi:MAG TPA: FecR domain-containing protein [Candidatus Angelobacter sp.]|nr:FecR domain-containing protein [Candidatus Angelobacter sp.]
MKHQKKNPATNSGELLDKAVTAMRSDLPESETIHAAGERVWQRLSLEATAAAEQVESIRGCGDVKSLLAQYRAGQLTPARALLVESHLLECAECRRETETGKRESSSLQAWKHELPPVRNTGFRWVAVAAALVIFAISTYFIQDKIFSGPQGMRVRVESFSGVLSRVGYNGDQPLKVGDEVSEGEHIRTGGASHAMLRLRDGSVVEMNERAEFGVSMGRKDTTVQLVRGNVIIQAAKRASGHLYVASQDCRVAVTGTVFSVNSGMKGSRVSVIEGEVHVAEAGTEKILHPGDQLTTNASLETVPVKQEIAWSQNLDQHLALLAEFAHFSNKLEQVQMPGLRYKSNVLPTLPANTVLFAGVPNLGDAVQQANKLFQQELQESAVLREWWQQVQNKNAGPDFNELINYVHDLGQYLGDEIVFSVAYNGQQAEPLVVAQVQRDGLKQFIQQETAKYADAKAHIQIVDQQELSQINPQKKGHQLLILVRPDFVAAAVDVNTLKQFSAGLNVSSGPNQGGGGFAASPFGQRISAQYQSGAEILFAANLAVMTSIHQANRNAAPERVNQNLERSGLSDVEYLIAERKGSGAQVLNHAELTFKSQRHGLASWLAAPAPIGGLDFVSKDAGAVAAFISKSPSAMLDDVLNFADANAAEKISTEESELKIRFHQDLADTLGGEVTFALDGPILPTPSWKAVVEVHDPNRLQSTIQQLISDVNEHLKGKNGAGEIALSQETTNGLVFYTIRASEETKPVEITYTFTDGYMVLGPSKALIMNAINIHQNGNSLAHSADFRALLPQDENPDVSAVLYQNLAPTIGPIAQQLSPTQLQSLQQIAAETKPSVVCAYGENNAIRVATSSRLFGFDLNTMALTALMNIVQPSHAHGARFNKD